MIRMATASEPIKVLGFTDAHLDDYAGCCRMTMKLIKETVETEKPDMVVFVGDNITGGDNLGRVRDFTDMMTLLNVPWAPVLGNHEGDNPYSVTREEMVRIFMTSPCCLIPDTTAALKDGSAVWGHANYSVPLYNDAGEMCHRLIFLDGGSDMSNEDRLRLGFGDVKRTVYDYLKNSQIKWYLEEIHEDKCPSTVFCHIPLPEFRTAMQEGELISGQNLESICCSHYNSGMFDAMLSEGKTTAFISGHDHINDSHYMYNGIRLIYNRVSGLSSYNLISKGLSDKLIQGCSVYRIHPDGSVTYSDIFYEDRYPGYHDEIHSVIALPGRKPR